MSIENNTEFRTKLTDNDVQSLSAHLEQNCDIPLVQLHGFLTATASIPLFITPDQWLFDLHLLEPESSEILNTLDKLHANIVDDLDQDQYQPSLLLRLYDACLSQVEKQELLKSWAQGYMWAMSLYVEDPETIVTSNEISAFLFVIESYFMSDDEILEYGDTENPKESANMIVELRYNASRLPVVMECAKNLYSLWFQTKQKHAAQLIAELQAGTRSLDDNRQMEA